MPARRRTASSEDLLSGKLVQLGNLLLRSAAARYHMRFGLRTEEWRILALLGSDESLALTDLARRAGLRKSQLSRGAAQLLRRKLLYRIVSSTDAREARLHLTPRGRTIHDAIFASAKERSAYLARGLKAKEIDRLLKTIGLLIRRAAELEAAG